MKRYRSGVTTVGVLILFLGSTLPALAEHFNITLTATAADGTSQEAYVDQSPPADGLNPRPVLKVPAGEPVTVQFLMTNVYPHGAIPDAGIHYFVRRKSDGKLITEGTYSLDLKPKARIAARWHMVIRKQGVYLLRVESLRTKTDHEHFSAIDFQVK